MHRQGTDQEESKKFPYADRYERPDYSYKGAFDEEREKHAEWMEKQDGTKAEDHCLDDGED